MRKNYITIKSVKIHSFLAMSVFLIGILLSGLTYGQGTDPFELGINCGSDVEYTALDGTVYVADDYFDGGQSANAFTGPLYTGDILGTEDDLLYQTYRKTGYQPLDDHFYNIPVDNGTYQVTLKFADYQQWQSNTGDLLIEGTQLLTSYNVQTEAGGPFTAHDLTYTVIVEDGELNMQFINDDGSQGDFFINAILVKEDVPFSLGINCGSDTDYTALDGKVYVADDYFDGGQAGNGFTGPLYTGDILGTEDDVLYQTYRKTGYQPLDDHFYNIQVENGNYEVTLKFADYQQWQSNTGNLIIEGVELLASYNVQTEAGGPFTAHDLTYTINVADGELNMQFINDDGSQGDFFINGIYISEVTEEYFALTTTIENGTITADPVGGSFISGSEVTLTVEPDYGYYFVEWTGDIDGIDDVTASTITVVMDQTRDLTAVLAQYTMYTFEAIAENGTVTVEPEPRDAYIADTELTLTAVPDYGYSFVEWTGDLTGVDDATAATITVMMDQNRTITAVFAENPMFKLTTSVTNGNLYISPQPDADGGMYYEGARVRLTAQPHVGYIFDGWSGDLSGTDNPITIVMDKDMDVTAEMLLNQFALTIVATNGTVNTLPVSGDVFEAGTQLVLQAVPDDGYRFVEWTGDLTGNENPTSITINSEMNIEAVFELIPEVYTLDVSATNGSVTTDPSGNSFEDGTVVTLTATPDDGYLFVGWSGDLTGSENPTTITVDGNKTVTAEFEIDDTSVYDELGNDPKRSTLGQNFPNPVSGKTTIPYYLKSAGQITLAVYNFTGQRVAVLVNEYQVAGHYSVEWDINDSGNKLPANGLYFMQLEDSNGVISTKKLIVKQ